MSDAIKQLLNLGILGAVSETELQSISPRPEFMTIGMGDTVTQRGEIGVDYYLLLRGRLRRFQDDGTGQAGKVVDIFPGDGVGASSILTGLPYDTTVRATQVSDLVKFSRAAFLQLMVLSWEFSISVTRTQVRRAQVLEDRRSSENRSRSVALVPVSKSVDCIAFAHALQNAIAENNSVMTCTADLLGSSKPTGDDEIGDRDTLVSHLDNFERQNNVVLYPTSHEPDPWARLALGRAETVLLIGAVGEPSDLSEIESTLIAPVPSELLPRTHLVLLDGGNFSQKARTGDWLEGRKIDEWHHLKKDSKEDFQRLARVLTGNANSLVLGGGGARSFSQIGVFRALSEARIPIDRISGTSMGAIVGGYIALGMGHQEILADIKQRWADARAGRDFTFPALSLLHCKGLHDAAIEVFGDRNIEDLKIPYFCVSSDITNNLLVYHDRGSMWKAVRASASFPGISPPLFDDGRLLVDGGLLNNLPCDIMAEHFSGKIIAVDVSEPEDKSVQQPFEGAPSGWQILGRKLNPFADALPVPSIFDVLFRSGSLASNQSIEQSKKFADLLLSPPVGDVGIIEFEKLEEMAEIGYAYTSEAVEKLDSENLGWFEYRIDDVK